MGEENHNPKLLRKLGENKIFKFECEVKNDNLKLALREINNNSPDYYEAYFILEELYYINDYFKTYSNLNEIPSRLLALFKRKTTKLDNLENGAKIKLHFETIFLADEFEFDFILDKKQV